MFIEFRFMFIDISIYSYIQKYSYVYIYNIMYVLDIIYYIYTYCWYIIAGYSVTGT